LGKRKRSGGKGASLFLRVPGFVVGHGNEHRSLRSWLGMGCGVIKKLDREIGMGRSKEEAFQTSEKGGAFGEDLFPQRQKRVYVEAAHRSGSGGGPVNLH